MIRSFPNIWNIGDRHIGQTILKRHFNSKQLAELHEKHGTIKSKTEQLVLKYVYFPFTDAKAKEYAHQGFSRRVQILKRCIDNVFRAVPPRTMKVPSKERLYDAQINIHAYLTNAFGSVDNLAWIWVHERGLAKGIRPRQVGLRKHNTEVRATFSADFRNYLDGIEDWLGTPPTTAMRWHTEFHCISHQAWFGRKTLTHTTQ